MFAPEIGHAIQIQWAVFIAGSALLAFACARIWKGATTPAIVALLAFPVAMIVSSMLAARIRTFHVGPGGINIDLVALKGSAEALVRANPSIAEAISHGHGATAVENAVYRIRNAETEEDLMKIIPMTTTNDAVLFRPTIDGKVFAIPVPTKSVYWAYDSRSRDKK